MKFIHLFSGGLDSTVLLYDLLDQGAKAHCLLFHYGQRHSKELNFAQATCIKLGAPYEVVTNIARNIGIDSRWNGAYQPPTKAARAAILRSRIESSHSPSSWKQSSVQEGYLFLEQA